MTRDNLYPLTQRIIETFQLKAHRTDAHSSDDPEDVIYLERSHGSDPEELSEGAALCIETHPDGKLCVRHDTAHHYGGWATHWDTGFSDADQVYDEVVKHMGPFIEKYAKQMRKKKKH